MKKPSTACVPIFCFTVALALAHDPRTTAKDFEHRLHIDGAGALDLRYKAMHFNAASFKRIQIDDQQRERMNTGVWSNIGSLHAGFDVVVGDQALAQGQYTLGLNFGRNDTFALVLKGADKAATVPLRATTDNPDVPYLTFALFPTDKPDTFVLEARCGRYRALADVKVPYLAEHTHPEPRK